MADTDMEVSPRSAQFEAALPPVMLVEQTAQGWRGLTEDGQILNVESSTGRAIAIPLGGSIAVTRNGQHVGFREIPKAPSPGGLIDDYTRCFEAAGRATRKGKLGYALTAIETAMSFAETLTTRYNRAMILFAMGRWREGFENYAQVLEADGSTFMRPQYHDCVAKGLTRWRGEDISGKRLLLIHDHGFGDSIMMLRYVRVLEALGADVVLWLPPELQRLASPCAPIVDAPVDADYFCSLLFLLQVLHQTPHSVPVAPYLTVDSRLVHKWASRIDGARSIGVTWTPGRTNSEDYPRAIPLESLANRLRGYPLISLQTQGAAEAAEHGVTHYGFTDFADCAALMLCCRKIVTIDTAAVHLAGAIGHPDISLLLGHWSSWRWLSPLYQNIRVCKQTVPDDWGGALDALLP
jgi:hypothetical protein